MSAAPTALIQDTTVVAVARDSLATVSAWATVGLGVAFALVLLVLFLILMEFRSLSKSWRGLLEVANDRARPLIDSANSAAQNVDYITQVVRTDVDRVNQAVSGLTEGLEDASLDIQGRLRDLTALLDLAQSEAEDAVLDAAARVRTLRAGARRITRTRPGPDGAGSEPAEAEGDGDD